MYKTKEKFFKDLVDCMINQTYANWELCLADGSEEKNQNLELYFNSIIHGEDIKRKISKENSGAFVSLQTLPSLKGDVNAKHGRIWPQTCRATATIGQKATRGCR